ncbi:RNA-binding region-containing protein (RNP-1) [Dictyostelium purpureum]|uniref:Polyadenylate-binding protein n=1 Tax=Dictyostelium purpureum TaxID=5786 RepID=F0ZBB9_DICPU|nr:RNA-binding region-containing protein (RNP-1) [Dictyostelium purpureum]EGC38747.1 RNA-binding region-containing protein (RNP-1) [Dictyostelium purpureum]|eukprot:XP_003284738.1 RNA-binding region-containing protein (RNP-1) [Dictyostelium purpureum]
MTSSFTPISSSLYVGDLLPEVSEQTLFEVFNQVGLVSNIRVCRDTNTRRSLSYAYVNYYNAADAERALDTLNNTPIRGKPCRIMWSQRDPSLRKSGVGNVFIKNLDKGIDHKALYDTFSAFGNILSCKVVTDDNNSSKGFGFVHYESQDSADKAIAKVNGMMINGQKVFVGPFKSSKERGQPTEIKFTNVFFKNLAEDVTSDQLKELLAPYGTITNVAIMLDEKTGKSKGFAFANFESADAAKNVVEIENGKVFHGKPLYAGRAQKKIEREAELKHTFETKYQGVNLYIKNIDDSIDNDKLREVFSQFGTITSAVVMKDDKATTSKGFGFVCYTSPDEATRAVTEMNGRMIGTKPLYVALAQRKDIRRAQLEMQHQQKFKAGMRQTMAPAYSGGPVFFTPAPVTPAVVYQQMMPRPRNWNGAPVGVPGNQYGMNYVRGGGQPRPNGQRPTGPRPNGQRPDSAQPIATQQPAVDQATQQPQAASGASQEAAPTLSSILALPTRDQQNVALGELLYPLIHNSQPELAGKITGMLLDSLPVEELFALTQRSDLLNEKIKEAIDVLNAN